MEIKIQIDDEKDVERILHTPEFSRESGNACISLGHLNNNGGAIIKYKDMSDDMLEHTGKLVQIACMRKAAKICVDQFFDRLVDATIETDEDLKKYLEENTKIVS